MTRLLTLAAALGAATSLSLGQVPPPPRPAAPTVRPTTPAPAARPTRSRPLAQIEIDIAQAAATVNKDFDFSKLQSQSTRAQLAATITPQLKKLVALLDERAALPGANRKTATGTTAIYLGLLTVLGDEESAKRLDTLAGDVKSDAADGRIGRAFVDWWMNSGDEEKQLAAFDKIAAEAKTNESTAAIAVAMIMEGQNLTKKGQKALVPFAADHFKTPELADARRLAQWLAGQLEFVDKPMSINGTTLDGKAFSTAAWKGKVIVVDFWASWCGPCRGEMPRMIQFYRDNHDKGVEFIGVSSDQSVADLRDFLRTNPAILWPQLFTAPANGEWHPLTKRLEVHSIPTMYIIDKNGICRSVQGRSDMEKIVPVLLAEEPAR